MPAETSKSRLKRRSSKPVSDEYGFDGGHARELEQKRSRGEVSCAECRRLKIKCDKKIPCQSCQRRGCATLCPNDSLSTGQGTRFVLAATEHLHHRISRLSTRVRQLEDALAKLQAEHSNEPHPLLHEKFRELEDDGDFSMTDAEAATAHDVIDALGTLSISDDGISCFLGPTGGSESLLISNHNSVHNMSTSRSAASPNPERSSLSTPSSTGTDNGLGFFSQSFPFTPLRRSPDVQALIESHLPSWERAQALSNVYLAQVSWIFPGITRVQLVDDLLPTIYRRPVPIHDDPDANTGSIFVGPHDLALVLMVFAVAALVQEEPSDELGDHFHQIAKAAIGLQPVLEKPSIVTIQVLNLMSIYNAMSGNDLRNETSMEMTWSLVTLAAHLSQTIGLHRDSARWGLSPKIVQRRRLIFWDIFATDVWQSLNTGRPPSFSLAYIDCAFPQPEESSSPDESFASRFGIWQFKFAAECVADVAARTLTAEAPTYATIMELDKKVREFPLPEGSSTSSRDFSTTFQRCILEHIRETILLYIHRSFFAQAIIDQPANPLKSPYAPSFLAAYRASTTILKSIRQQFDIWPNSSARFWLMWTFAFSAAIVFGTVVTRGPRSPLAQSAMSELEQACILFSKASTHSIRATKALPILTNLCEKARAALANAQKDPTPSSSTGDNGGLLWNIKKEDTEDELSIFAGRTRFVSGKTSARSDYKHQHVHGLSPQHAAATSSQPLPVPQPPVTPSVTPPEQEHTNIVQKGVFASLSSVDIAQYPYVPSERTHQMETSITSFSLWSDQPPYSPLDLPQPIAQQDGSIYSHLSSGMPGYDDRNQYTPQPQRPLMDALLPPFRQHPQQFQHQELQHSQHPPQQHHYGPMPPFSAPTQGAGDTLADLGLASRESRLDARWSSFMEDSGLLDSFGAH